MLDGTPMNEEKRQSIARVLGYLTTCELALLAGVKESTLDAWRKRKCGPAYVRLGNESLYPLDGVREYLSKIKKEQGRRFIVDAL